MCIRDRDLDFRNVHVQVQGQVAQKAQKQPLTEERLRGQMEKTGDTPFCFEELEVCTDQQSFLPMQSLNPVSYTHLTNTAQAAEPLGPALCPMAIASTRL